MLVFRSLHNIDLASNTVTNKQIPNDFASFTNDYLRFARENSNTKRYAVVDVNTQVVSCIRQIVQSILKVQVSEEENQREMELLARSIVERLLRSEIAAQEKIEQMNKYIKKGSLLQALIRDNNDNSSYTYIIAKVEHSEWFDGDSLQKSFGFPTEKKNVWKSAVIPLYVTEGEYQFCSIRVYTDNEARYWAREFLEVEEEKSDETNTKCAFEAIDRELRLSLKKDHPRDYYILRNSVIQTMKTPQTINYNINGLIGGYVPEDENVNTSLIQTRLLKLPEKKNFDTQFTTVPRAIVARKKLKFAPAEGIEINIDGSIDDYRNAIVAGVDENQKRILMVRCSDEATYKAFGGH